MSTEIAPVHKFSSIYEISLFVLAKIQDIVGSLMSYLLLESITNSLLTVLPVIYYFEQHCSLIILWPKFQFANFAPLVHFLIMDISAHASYTASVGYLAHCPESLLGYQARWLLEVATQVQQLSTSISLHEPIVPCSSPVCILAHPMITSPDKYAGHPAKCWGFYI